MEKNTNTTIAIVTTTFNRKTLISRLYKSLAGQSCCDFTWIVIDDGSTDDTQAYISSLQGREIEIKYVKIKNGGKSRALNYAFSQFLEYSLYVIVDSDDYLLPEAIEKIHSMTDKYLDDNRIGGIFFRYINSKTGKVIKGKKEYPGTEVLISRIKHNEDYGKYDGCISYFNRAVTRHRYPEYKEEKYIGPTVLQMLMAPHYEFIFTKIVIGVAEYQNTGITQCGRMLRLKNPLGMICYCGLMQQSSKILIRVKYAVMGHAYRVWGRISYRELQDSEIPKDYLPAYAALGGRMLALYWHFKYK